MTQEDFDLLRKAAEKRWPEAVITNSGIVLALAKIAARQSLSNEKGPRSRSVTNSRFNSRRASTYDLFRFRAATLAADRRLGYAINIW